MGDGIYLSTDRYQQLNGDLFEQNARQTLGDVWEQQASAAAPDLIAQAQKEADDRARAQMQLEQAQRDHMATSFETAAPSMAAQHLASLNADVAPQPQEAPQPPPALDTTQTAPDYAAPTLAPAQSQPAPFAPVTAPMSNPVPWQQPDSAPAAAATPTTAGISGGGDLSGRVGARGQQILSSAADAASWLGDQGQKALQAVLMTEGGLGGARGDQGKSAGPLQFYEGGQLANFAQQLGLGLEQAKQYVEQNPEAAIQWAIGTPDKPGYLGGAIQRGLQAGLQGADLATYAQRHGQVSVSPERAGQNFAAMFGGGQDVISGAGQAVADVASGAGRVVSAAVNHVIDNLRPSQFGVGLSNGEAYAACGPVAAMAFARATGRNPTAQEALDLAKRVGWSAAQGMAGPSSELDLLKSMGVASHMENGADPNKIAQDVQNGNPVIISTPGHYFVADGYNPQTGQFHVGTSGTDLRAGSEWMTLDGMQKVMGSAQATLYLDRQPGDGPSVAAQMAQAPTGPTYMGVNQPAQPSQPQPSSPIDTFKQKLGDAFSDLLAPIQHLFGGTTSSTPPVPEGGGYGAVPPGGVNPLPGIVDQATQALPGILYGPTGRPPTAEEFALRAAANPTARVQYPDNPLEVLGGASLGAPTSGEAATTARNEAIAGGNPLRDVPVVGGATTFAGQTIADPTNLLLFGPGIGKAGLEAGAALAESPEVQAALRARQPAQAEVGFAMGLPTGGQPVTGAAREVSTREGNFLQSHTLVPTSDPRPPGPNQPGLPNVKAVMQQNLAEVLPSDATLYHETSLPSARAILQRVEAGPRNQSGIWTSDNRDLALGQGGNGVVLEFDPALVNGGAGENPTKAFSAQAGLGTEYQIDKTLRGAVQAIVVKTQWQADQLAADPLIAGRFDFSAAQQTPDGIRIPYAGLERGAARGLPPNEPPVTAAPTTSTVSDLAASLASPKGAPGVSIEPYAIGGNPFALETQAGPGLLPMTEEDIASHLEDLGTRYETNDARIQELENQLGGGGLGPGGVGVQRPPWAVGLTNDAITQIAKDQGTSAYKPLWWEGIGFNVGSREVQKFVGEGGYRGTGAAQLTPTQARAELSRLMAENDQIMAATDVPEGATTLYRRTTQTTPDLPWQTYTPPANERASVPASSPTGAGPVPAVGSPAQTFAAGANQGGAAANPPVASAGVAAPGGPLSLKPVTTGSAASPTILPTAAPPVIPPAPPAGTLPAAVGAVPPSVPTGGANAWDYLRALRVGSLAGGIQTVSHILLNAPLQTAFKLVSDAPLSITRPETVPLEFMGAWQGIRGWASNAASAPLGQPGKIAQSIGGTAGQAVETGLLGLVKTHPVIQDMARQIGTGMELWRQAGIEASNAGLTRFSGPWWTEVQNLVANPTAEMETAAQRAGDTFSLGGKMGEVGQAFANLRQDSKAVDFVMPFFNIGYHVATQGIERSPIGLLGTALDVARAPLGSGPYAAGRVAEGVTPLAQRFRNNMVGVGLAVEAYHQASQGNITGNGPDDPKLKQDLLATGWQPDSVRVGGRYFPLHVLGPLGWPLAEAANLYEATHTGEQGGYAKPNADPQGQFASYLGRMAQFGENETFLRSIGQLLQAAGNAKDFGRLGEQEAASTLGSLIPQGALLSNIASATDPFTRRPAPGDIGQAIQNRLPGLRQDLPLKLTPTGQPVQNPSQGLGILLPRSSLAAPDPVINAMGQAGIGAPTIPKTIPVTSKYQMDLTSDEQQRWQELHGQALNDQLKEVVTDPDWAKLTQDRQRQLIQKALTKASDVARKQLLDEMPDSTIESRVQLKTDVASASRVTVGTAP